MGAIQATINTALATGAGLALGATKMKEEKKAAIQQATSELPKVNEQLFANQQAIEANTKEMAKAQTGRNKLGQFRSKAAVQNDIEKIRLARETLLGNREALKMSKQGYEKLLGGK